MEAGNDVCKDFVEATICNLSESVFEELKQLLLEEYISFSIINHKDVTVDILAEKVCDYFVSLEAKTGKSFEKHVESYVNDIDDIVRPHIPEISQFKKGDTEPIDVPRSRRYYDKAITAKKLENQSIAQLVDYSRIMMCLYAAANKNKEKPIENFDYSVNCLIPTDIVNAMKSEESSGLLPLSKKKRFDTKERYSDNVCTLILSILILYSIINGKVEGEADCE